MKSPRELNAGGLDKRTFDAVGPTPLQQLQSEANARFLRKVGTPFHHHSAREAYERAVTEQERQAPAPYIDFDDPATRKSALKIKDLYERIESEIRAERIARMTALYLSGWWAP